VRPRGWLGVIPAGVVAAASVGVVLLSSRSPTRLDLGRAWAAPSLALPFGAGEAGVDLLAVVAHAVTRGLGLAAAVTLVGFSLGTPLGAAAGLAGGARAAVVLRACDLVQAFPTFLLALAVLAAVRVPGREHIGLVFCIGAWAPFARLALLQATVLRSAQFVDAARALGATSARVTLRHVLPNLLGPVAVQAGSAAAAVVLGEASLGFLGLGPRDGVSLGAVLEQGTVAMLRAPHVLLVGAGAVAAVSGALQLASEALRSRVGGAEG
jgi:peptide/nickel transport system permease protein